MEDDPVVIESNLTSTIGNVLLSQSDDRNDANDSIPTSSTDAASTYSPKCLNATDDPISSTSSDPTEREKQKTIGGINKDMKTKTMDVSKGLLGNEGDVDLLDMNMSNVSTEPIIEDVEDIVQDLENLLGEPEPVNEFSARRKESQEKLEVIQRECTKEREDKIESFSEITPNDVLPKLVNIVEENKAGENYVTVFEEVKDTTRLNAKIENENELITNESKEAISSEGGGTNTEIINEEGKLKMSEDFSDICNNLKEESSCNIEEEKPSKTANENLVSEDVIDHINPLMEDEVQTDIIENEKDTPQETETLVYEDVGNSSTDEKSVTVTVEQEHNDNEIVARVEDNSREQVALGSIEVCSLPQPIEKSSDTPLSEVDEEIAAASEIIEDSEISEDPSTVISQILEDTEPVVVEPLDDFVGNNEQKCIISAGAIAENSEAAEEGLADSKAEELVNDIKQSDFVLKDDVKETSELVKELKNDEIVEKTEPSLVNDVDSPQQAIPALEENESETIELPHPEENELEQCSTIANVHLVESPAVGKEAKPEMEESESVMTAKEVKTTVSSKMAELDENAGITESLADELEIKSSEGVGASEITSKTEDSDENAEVTESQADELEVKTPEAEEVADIPSEVMELEKVQPMPSAEISDNSQKPDPVVELDKLDSGSPKVERLEELKVTEPQLEEFTKLDSMPSLEASEEAETIVEELDSEPDPPDVSEDSKISHPVQELDEVVSPETLVEESIEKINFKIPELDSVVREVTANSGETEVDEEIPASVDEVAASKSVIEESIDELIESESDVVEKESKTPTRTDCVEETEPTEPQQECQGILAADVEEETATVEDIEAEKTAKVGDVETEETSAAHEKIVEAFVEVTAETLTSQPSPQNETTDVVEEITETEITQLETLEETAETQRQFPSRKEVSEDNTEEIAELQETHLAPQNEITDAVEEESENQTTQLDSREEAAETQLQQLSSEERVSEDVPEDVVETRKPQLAFEEEISKCAFEEIADTRKEQFELSASASKDKITSDGHQDLSSPDVEMNNLEEKVQIDFQTENKQTEEVSEEVSTRNKEELVPVVEEVIVKKTIIYEHDCHQHVEEARTDFKEDVQEKEEKPVDANLDDDQVVKMEKNEPQPDEKSNEGKIIIDDSSSSDEFIESSSSQERVEKDDSNSSLNEVLQVVHKRSLSQLAKADEDTKEPEPVIGKSTEDSPGKSMDTQEETVQIIEDTIQDQTTAAVQSILDNMLEEKKKVEMVTEKEETILVHSSYSSYELQKAVQQIQDITQTVDLEEISSEYITNAANKLKEKEEEKLVQVVEVESTENDDCKVMESFEVQEPIEQVIEPEQSGVEVEESVALVEESIAHVEESVLVEESVAKVENELPEDKSGGHVVEIVEIPEEDTVVESEVLKRPEIPLVEPSIDLSEESSTEESSEDEKTQKVTSSVQEKEEPIPHPKVVQKEIKKPNVRETRHSSRINDKVKEKTKENVSEPLSINVGENDEKNSSPKITIKPIKEGEPPEDKEEHKGSLKITITKQSDNTHSILKICSPESENRLGCNDDQNVVPKLVIKTSEVDQHSPKITTRSGKQGVSTNANQRSGSPRITIKPIVKPDVKEVTSPLKITIKPMGKPEEFSKQQQQRHSPKPSKNKSEDDHYGTRSKVLKSSENSEVHSPKVTIKPIVKPDEVEVVTAPKITIKPIEKPEEAKVSPKITIKPVVRQVEQEFDLEDESKKRIVLKINKGTIPTKESEKIGKKREHEDDKSEKLAKIKLKFSKGGDAHIVHEERRKRSHEGDAEKAKKSRANDSDEDVTIIENRQSPIVISEDSRSQDSVILVDEAKDPLADPAPVVPVVPTTPMPRKRGRPRKVPLVVREEFQKEEASPKAELQPAPVTNETPPDTEISGRPKRSCRGQSVRDTLGMKPRKQKSPPKPRGGKRGGKAVALSTPAKEFSELIKKSLTEQAVGDAKAKEDAKAIENAKAIEDAKSIEDLKTIEDAKVIEEAKAIGDSKAIEDLKTIEDVKAIEDAKEAPKAAEEKPPSALLELKGLLEAAKDQNIIEVIEIDSPEDSQDVAQEVIGESVVEKVDGEKPEVLKEVEDAKDEILGKDDADLNKEPSELGTVDTDVEMQPPTPVLAPPLCESSTMDLSHSTDIAMFEEETRMSAEANSRAQTPAKQVVSSDVVVEESQSSMQSTATTESGKISRRSRLEVHQDIDNGVFTADQLNEYYWGGNGPFMMQEQVAQFLGIKSFKRKYPNIPRRMVDMQERDYIRENGLASESMCDLGLTAVSSADILDIMYTDFQEKYEEYCKIQRDKQAKDLLNKQRALSLQAGQEKSKLDIVEQAVHSAAAYNTNFNKVRREQRRACMDLQTMNVHYPKGRMKQANVSKIGHYPVALVPGQFTDYYKEFTPTELNHLPLNTMLYTELHKILPENSDSDSDSSGSDSEDGSSSSSDSDSSCGDSCKMCSSNEKRSTTPRKSPIHAGV